MRSSGGNKDNGKCDLKNFRKESLGCFQSGVKSLLIIFIFFGSSLKSSSSFDTLSRGPADILNNKYFRKYVPTDGITYSKKGKRSISGVLKPITKSRLLLIYHTIS